MPRKWRSSNWWSSTSLPRTVAVELEYDGTRFAGFQIQTDLATVQGELESAISAIAGTTIRIVGAGRTDTGVHALGQVASFTTESDLDADTWVRALNAHLPPDIAVIRAWLPPPGFHARFSATGRSYRYVVLNRRHRSAVDRTTAWHSPGVVDVTAMRQAAQVLLGQHDFAAFAGKLDSGGVDRTTVRTIRSADWTCEGDRLVFEITADAFLPHMVRSIVGTLLLVGRGKRSVEDITRILLSRDRAQAGATAPPHGLFLVRVHYGDQSK